MIDRNSSFTLAQLHIDALQMAAGVLLAMSKEVREAIEINNDGPHVDIIQFGLIEVAEILIGELGEEEEEADSVRD